MTDGLPLLAEAKLAAPRQRRGMVPRPRLEHALEAGADAALTLVAAPAGYGKTTAVRAWADHSGSALAWVTLDAGDNEPARLWSYVATAVDRIRNGLGRRAINRLHASATMVDVAVDEVMNGIAEFGQPITLVLDDLQTVRDSECLASLRYAIERLPSTARLVVITRADPALELGRLRGRGALSEVRARELAFTAGEARELLVDRGELDLDDEQIEVLLKRTEGWPAALYLAALWLRSVEDRDRAVHEFGGGHRHVAEYLSHEVLASLDAGRRAFLLRAAVLGSFTAELCDAALNRSDSAAVLAELEESGMFVLSLERREWFRVHALFAEFATAQLGAVEPTVPQTIHRRAAEWLRGRGLVVEAVQHAAAAGDLEVVAELLSEYHLALIRNGRSGTLVRWAQAIPDESLIDHPGAAVGAATAALLVGRMTRERRRFLRLADRARAEHPERFGALRGLRDRDGSGRRTRRRGQRGRGRGLPGGRARSEGRRRNVGSSARGTRSRSVLRGRPRRSSRARHRVPWIIPTQLDAPPASRPRTQSSPWSRPIAVTLRRLATTRRRRARSSGGSPAAGAGWDRP